MSSMARTTAEKAAPTTMAEAFDRAGMSRCYFEIGALVMRALQQGASEVDIDRAVADGKARFRATINNNSCEGHHAGARQGHSQPADARSAGGAGDGAASDRPGAAAPPVQVFENSREGHREGDRQVHQVRAVARTADGEASDVMPSFGPGTGRRPVREPSAAQRAAAGSVAKSMAITVLDTLKIDGRAIGDWTVAEARAAGRTKTREGYILIEVARVVANAPGHTLVRDIAKPGEVQRIMQRAAEVADAA